MKFLTDETILFFLKCPENLELWETTLCPWLSEKFPAAELYVQRTQITLKGRIGFLVLSLPPRKLAPKGQPAILLTFGLRRSIQWERIASFAPISAHRITYHTLVRGPEDLDDVLLGYLQEAWEMAN